MYISGKMRQKFSFKETRLHHTSSHYNINIISVGPLDNVQTIYDLYCNRATLIAGYLLVNVKRAHGARPVDVDTAR